MFIETSATLKTLEAIYIFQGIDVYKLFFLEGLLKYKSRRNEHD